MTKSKRAWRYGLISLGVASITVLAGCQAPITYAAGRTAGDLPTNRTQVVFDGVSQSDLLGTQSVSPISVDHAHLNDVISDLIKSKLQAAQIAIADKRNCLNCADVKGFIYLLPWNPIIGGHVNIFIRAYAPDGTELFTAFRGRDFGLIHVAAEGGTEEIVKSLAEKAADYFVNEFRKVGQT